MKKRCICNYCHKDYLNKQSRKSKYCSRKCSSLAQKGRKMPHSLEWEQNRLKGIKKYYSTPEAKIKTKIFFDKNKDKILKGIKKAGEIQKALRKANPDKYNQISKNNLPKDVSGNKNGNWKGGRTAKNYKWRTANIVKLNKWRKFLLERDGNYCRMCGATNMLEAHHIIPLSETKLLAFSPMNGVILCRKCHRKHDEVIQGKRFSNNDLLVSSSGLSILCFTIPHNFHVYPTVGNYEWIDINTLVIFVSKLDSEVYEFLVFLHELVEAFLAKHRGISVEEITDFDVKFENGDIPNSDKVSEPGNHPLAPYKKEHKFAEKIEILLANELKINWTKYEGMLDKLYLDYPRPIIHESSEENVHFKNKGKNKRFEIKPEIGK